MTWRSASGWWLAAALGSTLGAQANPGDAVMAAMNAKLAASFVPAPPPGRAGGAVLLLANPGVPLTAEQTQDPYDLSMLVDQVPLPSAIYQPSANTYSAVYSTVLRVSHVSKYENQAELNRSRLTKRLMEDRRRPGHYTRMYAEYLRYRAVHDAALDALNLAQVESQANGTPVPPGLDQAVDRALRLWEARGHKQPFDAALKGMDTAYDNNLRILFFDLKKTLDTAAIDDGHPSPYYPFEADPPLSTWLGKQGWQTWNFSASDLQVMPPPAKVPAGKATSKAGPANPEWTASITMTAQLKRVNITRPWLDAAIFKSHAWTLFPDSGFTLVSSGDPKDPDPGLMPLMVTGLLLAKDLVMSGSWQDASGAAEAPGALGPFALATPVAARGLPLHPFLENAEGSLTIRLEGTQIIGFFCELLPRTPAPDPKLFR